jgi:hypothetical protein
MQEASHRFGSWALEEACSGSSSGVRNRITKLVKLQWRDQSPFSYSTPVPLRVLQLLWHAGSLAVDAAAANEERASHAAWPCALCTRCTWQEYRYLIKELKQEYMLAAVLVDASCKR